MRRHCISRMSDMTTRPITKPQIDVPSGEGDLSLPAYASSMAQEWRRVGNFLLSPTLDPNGSSRSPLVTLARVYVLDLAIMFGLLTLVALVMAAGIELPRTAIADMEITFQLVLLVVIGAPVLEELAFRSWLNGKPGWLVSLLLLALAGIGGAFWGVFHTGDAAVAGVAAIMLGAAPLCIIALALLRNRSAPGWYRIIFPGAFWLSAAGFALIHVANFAEQPWYAVLPLVLPQLLELWLPL